MPRVVNLALAVVVLLFLVPLFTHLGRLATSVRIMLVCIAAPFLMLAALSLMSAARPGSVGRLFGRLRRTR